MAIKITRDELDQYRELLERKRANSVESAALKEEIEQFEARVQEQMVADKKETCKRFGWIFSLVRGNRSVSWKKEFIALAGKEKAIELVSAGTGQGKVKVGVTPPQDLAYLFEKPKDSDE